MLIRRKFRFARDVWREFRLYVSNFGSYSATYGSLGVMIILMLWLYLSGIALLIGSEINALLDRKDESGSRS